MKKKEVVFPPKDESHSSDAEQRADRGGTLDAEQGADRSGALEGGDIGGEGGPEDVPMLLAAVCPILYLSHQYKVGDALPANDPAMTQAWLEAGTAAWIRPAGVSPKAGLRTAEPGLFGKAAGPDNGGCLVGKIPKTSAGKR